MTTFFGERKFNWIIAFYWNQNVDLIRNLQITFRIVGDRVVGIAPLVPDPVSVTSSPLTGLTFKEGFPTSPESENTALRYRDT